MLNLQNRIKNEFMWDSKERRNSFFLKNCMYSCDLTSKGKLFHTRETMVGNTSSPGISSVFDEAECSWHRERLFEVKCRFADRVCLHLYNCKFIWQICLYALYALRQFIASSNSFTWAVFLAINLKISLTENSWLPH